ncbi:MAG: sigma 54-interacting transcriptional regulator [bacterium]
MTTRLADLDTQSRSSLTVRGGRAGPLGLLTILAHPEARRVGDEAWLTGLVGGQPVALSRLEPTFAPPRGGAGWPLADAALSRRPAWLERAASGIRLRVPADALKVAVEGEPWVGDRVFSAAELTDGVVLTLGRDVVVLLQEAEPWLERPEPLGLVGESGPLQQLRGELLRVAEAAVPVLLRGETGTGKELAASAIHRHSPRRTRAWVPVSVAAVGPSTALSSLFGHVRGAFTGAVTDHDGCFAQADGGTLFLDEIGEAPPEVQAMLLRVLETGTFQPLGGAPPAASTCGCWPPPTPIWRPRWRPGASGPRCSTGWRATASASRRCGSAGPTSGACSTPSCAKSWPPSATPRSWTPVPARSGCPGAWPPGWPGIPGPATSESCATPRASL